MKNFFVLSSFLVVTALALGCSNRSSTQEATADCQSLAKVDPTIQGSVFNQCVACFENCSDCEKKGTSPPTFKCPDDSGSGGGGGASSTTASSTSTGK
jgi:hypothetical protein